MDSNGYGNLEDEGLWEDLYSAEAEPLDGSVILSPAVHLYAELLNWILRPN